MRERLLRAIRDDGALINAAATEEARRQPRPAAPSRGRRLAGTDGRFRLTGEKSWTTWLPGAPVRPRDREDRPGGPASARSSATGRRDDPPEVAAFLVDLEAPGVDRLPGFDALGMRGSASGRLRLDGVVVPADSRRRATPAGGRIRGRRSRRPGSGRGRRRLPRGRGGRPRGRGRAGRSTGGRAMGRPRSRTSRRSRSGSVGSTRRSVRPGSWCSDVARVGRRPIVRCEPAVDRPDVALAKLAATNAAVGGHRRGAADRRRPGVPRRAASSERSATRGPA